MSVLRCNRRGCENIMCDRYSYKHGYICNECFEELVGVGGIPNIEEFLETKKDQKFDTRGYLDKEFPLDS